MPVTNYLIVDCEIVNAIPPKREPLIAGITYCKGWGDYAGMGISVICAWEIATDRPRVFLRSTFSDFYELAQTCHVVSYNGLTFDDRLLAAHDMPVISSYDIYRELLRAVGLDPFPDFYSVEYGGRGLDAVCRANGGIVKTEGGANAPILWQQKQAGKVIDYCLNDVSETRKLFLKILRGEGIVDPATGRTVYPRMPEQKEAYDIARFFESACRTKKSGHADG